MPKRKFYFIWFSPSKRKIVRPEVNVEIGSAHHHSERIHWESASTLPQWATNYRNRRALSLITGSLLIALWAISVSDMRIGWAGNLAMMLAIIGVLSLLNFSLRSLFDVSVEQLDERLVSLRNKYSFQSFQVFGLLILCLIATLDFLNIDASRMWFPAIATYASTPYLLMAWQEKDFS